MNCNCHLSSSWVSQINDLGKKITKITEFIWHELMKLTNHGAVMYTIKQDFKHIWFHCTQVWLLVKHGTPGDTEALFRPGKKIHSDNSNHSHATIHGLNRFRMHLEVVWDACVHVLQQFQYEGWPAQLKCSVTVKRHQQHHIGLFWRQTAHVFPVFHIYGDTYFSLRNS